MCLDNGQQRGERVGTRVGWPERRVTARERSLHKYFPVEMRNGEHFQEGTRALGPVIGQREREKERERDVWPGKTLV